MPDTPAGILAEAKRWQAESAQRNMRLVREQAELEASMLEIRLRMDAASQAFGNVLLLALNPNLSPEEFRRLAALQMTDAVGTLRHESGTGLAPRA